MAHEINLGDSRSDGWHGPPAVRPVVIANGLAGAAGILAGMITGYLNRHGPSGAYPHPWSYTGNGALDVLAYFPLILMSSWTVLILWQRGYRQPVATMVALTVLLSGVLAGVVNEIGVVGQLPDVEHTRPIFSPIANFAVALLALTVGLGLAARFAGALPRRPILALILTLATVAVAVALSLTGGWFWLSFTQSLLVPLTILLPLIAGGPRPMKSHPVGSRVVTVVGSVLVPIALVGGFALEAAATGAVAG